MVEHRLAKARVASSNLVSRSIPPSGASRVGYGGMERITYIFKAALPRRGTQVVRERSAKPLCAGSIPARASKSSQPLSTQRKLAGCQNERQTRLLAQTENPAITGWQSCTYVELDWLAGHF